MIVCICNRINCSAVREAVKEGARAPQDVQKIHGCKFNCGKCKQDLSDLICDEMENSVSPPRFIAAE